MVLGPLAQNPNLEMKDKGGLKIARTEDFKYLGSWIRTSTKDVSIRIALGWSAVTALKTIWQ